MRSHPPAPGSRGAILETIAMVGAIAAPVLIGAAMGAKRRFRRIASESGGQPLRTEDTARAVVSGAFVGGLTGAALTAAVAALIEVRG